MATIGGSLDGERETILNSDNLKVDSEINNTREHVHVQHEWRAGHGGH
jgi:hypothetical protein